MSMPAIHQFLAGFSRADAISNEARVLQRLFRNWGCRSGIFSEQKRILPELRRDVQDVSAYGAVAGREDIALLHLSIGSPVNTFFAGLDCRKAILYHNITAARFFERINRRTANNLQLGRRQVRELAGKAEVNMADSRFNADELEAEGYRDVQVLPLVIDLDRLLARPDRAVARARRDGHTNILFVGRCAPNKRIEDCLRAFSLFQATSGKRARFIHVGSFAGTERYYSLLLSQARGMDLENIEFAGSVSQSGLNAYYSCADLFLCMSEHEGFCVPLLEAMMHDVPVLAFAAGAVPETMDGAGILFRRKEFGAVAEMMTRIAGNNGLREAVVEGQRRRLARYRQRDLASELRQHLAPLMQQRSAEA